jgi:hypothetical protein
MAGEPILVSRHESDRLDPVRGGSPPIASYENAARSIFAEVYRSDVVLRGVTTPSFTPEYAVAIARRGDAWHLLAVQPKANLWYSADRLHVTVAHCDAEISATFADRLTEIWTRMLTAPQNIEPAMGADGTLYDFAVRQKRVMLEASAWSPDHGSLPAELAALAGTMRAYCNTRAFAWSPWALYAAYKLGRDSALLLARLKASPP